MRPISPVSLTPRIFEIMIGSKFKVVQVIIQFFLESILWYFAKYNIRVVMYILHIMSIAILKGHITLLAQTCDCSYLITIIEQDVLNTLRTLWYQNVNSRLFYFHTFFYDIDKRILGIYHFLPETINSNLIRTRSLLIVERNKFILTICHYKKY